MSKQELVKKEDKMPAFLQKIDAKDTRGNEAVGADDLTIPRIELCQSLSKARKKTDPSYIEGIEEGQFYNNLTREVYGSTIVVIPILFMKEYLLWKDVNHGGGFGGSYHSQAEAEDAQKMQEEPAKWEVVPTNQQFVLVVKADGSMEEAVMSMAKSKNRVSRNWNSLIRINGGPRFSRKYKLTGVADQNQAGQDYYNVLVENYGFVNEKEFNIASDLYEVIASGSATIDRTIEGEGAVTDAQVIDAEM